MRVYQAERNDPCPCGSGRKYKKCCQAEVEHQTRLISQAVGPGVTAHGREVIETLGFMIGLKQPEGHPPDATLLGQLLREVWEKEEEELGKGKADFEQILEGFAELMQNKPNLRYLRIPGPVWFAATEFAKEELGEEEKESDLDEKYLDAILDYTAEELGTDWIVDGIEQMALSLQYDSYNNDELKTLLTVLGWWLDPSKNEILLTLLLSVTAADLAAGQSELKSILESSDDDSMQMQKARQLFIRYPVLEEVHSARLVEEVELAYRQIMDGSLNLDVPFYAISGGTFAALASTIDLLEKMDLKKLILAADLPARELLGPALWEEGEVRFFLHEVLKLLKQEQEKNPDSPLGRSLESLMVALAAVVTVFQVQLVETLYIRCIARLHQRFPLHLPGVDTLVEGPVELLDPAIIEEYAAYLESQDQKEEANHLRRQYQAYGAGVKEKLAVLPELWVEKLLHMNSSS
ncbi:MAG: SEC-C domain-containing protein [Clostridia bacterium]|nr:SEC-C domain-containing protein [Clostridia bacterium]